MLEIGPIVLREWEREDLKRVHEWENDFLLMLYSRGKPHNISTYEDVEEHYEEERKSKKRQHYIIALRDSGEKIGTAVIRLSDWTGVRTGNTGTYLDRKYWNHGLGKIITIGLLDVSFYMMNLDRCEAWSIEFNKRAHRVLEACGFKKVGRNRKAAYIFGERWDWYIFDILKEEYMEIRVAMVKSILGSQAEEYLKNTGI